MEENVTLGPEITTLGYVCSRLKIVSSFLPRSLPSWRKKPPTRPSPSSEVPELNTKYGQAEINVSQYQIPY